MDHAMSRGHAPGKAVHHGLARGKREGDGAGAVLLAAARHGSGPELAGEQ